MPASVQHSPSWVCAETLGPIFPHHTPKVVANMVPRLLGRRPAVRRKPLNPWTSLDAIDAAALKAVDAAAAFAWQARHLVIFCSPWTALDAVDAAAALHGRRGPW